MADTSRHEAPGPGAGLRRLRSSRMATLRGFSGTALATLFAFSLVGALFVARDVLIPFALAALLSFLLALPVRGLRKLGLRQSAAVALVILGALLSGAALGPVDQSTGGRAF